MYAKKCINCGSSLDASCEDKYIRCEYCGTTLGNFSPFERIEHLVLGHEQGEVAALQDILCSLDVQKYEDVLAQSNALLARYPTSWIGLTYKAIGLFWLGLDDFGHLPEVIKTIEKAKRLSTRNEFVLQAADVMGNNLVLIASKNEQYGDELLRSLDAFALCRDFCTLNEHSKRCIARYCQSAAEHIDAEIKRLLNREKKSFQLAMSYLNTLKWIFELSGSIKAAECLYLFGNHHLQKNGHRPYAEGLRESLSALEQFLIEQQSPMVHQQLVFGWLGQPKFAAKKRRKA